MGKTAGRDPLLGQVVGGRYEVIRLIGKGGMGAIYEVRNVRLGRAFALKTLIGEASEDIEVLQRFRREADLIARIKHPNIVEIIDWEELEDGSPCMVLEYLHGEDLAHRVRDSAPLPWAMIAKLGDQVLSALSVAHAANIVHRDLKPQNIFLATDDSGEERAKLLDFGVSKIRDSRSLVTTDARLLGTPSYMSPEQAEGRHEDIGPATDLWAMGAILYEMATGDLAFDGPSMPAVLYKICSKSVEPIQGRRADAPQAFSELIAEALAREGTQRITDADVFRVRLRQALADVASVRYSDNMQAPSIAARGSNPSIDGQVTPKSATAPTPRRKRLTGAHDETLHSQRIGVMATLATPVTAAAMQTPAPSPSPSGNTPVDQVSTSTLDTRGRSFALIGVIAGIAAAMVIVVIVLAATRERGTADELPVRVPKAVDGLATIDAAGAAMIVDAGVLAIVDAAIAMPIEPDAVAPVRVIKQPPAKKDPPVVVQPPAPPSPPPPKPKSDCSKYTPGTPEHSLCVNQTPD